MVACMLAMAALLVEMSIDRGPLTLTLVNAA
jgi:hypothetical protein